MSPGPIRPGGLVISLDFELHWGTRDHVAPGDPAFDDLRGERRVVPELLAAFTERRVRATWAVVGCLFASTGAELAAFLPDRRPAYRRPELDPYRQVVGADEEADPEHLAGSLVDRIAGSHGQEVGSHTFAHYYALEEGQTEAEFRADLAAAQAIAASRGLTLASLVLPRNQWNPAYAPAVLDAGFRCIRGPQPSWSHRARPAGRQRRPLERVTRLTDTYVGLRPPPTVGWEEVAGPDGLCDVPASAFLRPWSPRRRALEPLRRARLTAGLREAARRGRLFHLWWHPHNFARHPGPSFELLGHVLDEFERLRATEGMVSLTMGQVAEAVTPRRRPGADAGTGSALRTGAVDAGAARTPSGAGSPGGPGPDGRTG